MNLTTGIEGFGLAATTRLPTVVVANQLLAYYAVVVQNPDNTIQNDKLAQIYTVGGFANNKAVGDVFEGASHNHKGFPCVGHLANEPGPGQSKFVSVQKK